MAHRVDSDARSLRPSLDTGRKANAASGREKPKNQPHDPLYDQSKTIQWMDLDSAVPRVPHLIITERNH